MITYLLGMLAVLCGPDLNWVWLALPAGALLALLRPLRTPLLLFLLGMLVASAHGYWQLVHRYQGPPRDLVMTAEVVDLPRLDGVRQRLLIRPLEVETLPAELQSLRRLSVSHYQAPLRYAAGDRIRVALRLQPPRGLSNPAAQDRERFYLSRGIDARGYVRQLQAHQPGGRSLPRLRQALADWLAARFAEPAAGTLKALLLGDRSGLSPAQRQVLQLTGSAHLFVVSGLHVAVLALLGWGLGRLLQPLMPPGRAQRLLVPATALVVAGSYAWLSGWGVPVQRAWLMLAVFVLSGLLLRPLTGWQRWRLALGIIASLQPLALLEAGTWLSFAAVALILWLWQQRDSGIAAGGRGARLGFWLRLQLLLFVGMLPWTVMIFGQFNPLSVPVNLLAIPVLTLIIWLLPAWLLLSAWLPTAGAGLERLLAAFWQGLYWMADTVGLHASLLPQPTLWVLLLALAGLALMLLPLPSSLRWLALPLLLPLLFGPGEAPPPGHYRAWLFDVGQGLAVLIETADGVVLYDTGPGYRGGGSAFVQAVQPRLAALGRQRVQVLVLSHGDNDHAGGYAALMQRFAVARVYAGERQPVPSARRCTQQQWQLGAVHFTLQQPLAGQGGATSNNRSCVLRVDNGHCSLLLTGDLASRGEYRLLSAGQRQPVTWLVAGHHGSRDSTTPALLDWLQPQQVLFSAGWHNRFGHPHPEVLARLRARGIPWQLTARDGAIEMVADREQCRTYRHRQQKKRYWTAS